MYVTDSCIMHVLPLAWPLAWPLALGLALAIGLASGPCPLALGL